jgi:hypothetical protein
MLFVAVMPSYAAVLSATGTVFLLRTHDSVYGADTDWFSLVGVTSMGTCKTGDAGYVVLKIWDDQKGQRMFTIALAAKTSGAALTVWVDDTDKDSSGNCYVRFMQ